MYCSGQLVHVQSSAKDRAPLVPGAGILPMPESLATWPTVEKRDYNDLLLKQANARAKKKEDCF